MKNLSKITLLLLLSAFIFCTCSNDDKREIEEFTLTVASVQPLMFNFDHYNPYYVKYEGKNEWKTFPYIKNFTYNRGYEYVIRVRKERVIFEDIIGGSPYEITLLQEISKLEKTSENIPIQKGWLKVASKKTGDEHYPYYVSAPRTGNWIKFYPIEGFEHEEGYEYLIDIDCKYNSGTNIYPYSFIYTSTERKEKRDSAGLPK